MRNIKLLLAAVMMLAVICVGTAFAADPAVSVDLKMIKSSRQPEEPTPLPNDELRLWVTRRIGSPVESLQLANIKGEHPQTVMVLFSTHDTPGDEAKDWLTNRRGGDTSSQPADGVIAGTGISYQIQNATGWITLSADVTAGAKSGDRATIYVYGGKTDWTDYSSNHHHTTSVYAGYEDDPKNVTPFPDKEISLDIKTQLHGGVITSFDVVVLSSDAELVLEQIESDTELAAARRVGPNVIEKDASGKITGVNKNWSPETPHIDVNLADGTVQLIVVSADSEGNLDTEYLLRGLDQNDVRVYLRAGETHVSSDVEPTVCSLKPQIDQSGTITYLIGEPDMLAALLEYVKTDPRTLFHIDFDDLNTKYGWSIPAYSLSLSFYHRGGSSSTCAAGSAVFIGLAALALIKRRSK